MTNENIIFSRYEFKYIVDNVIANKIQEKLQSYIRLDNFAKEQKSQSYKVVSLYFDDNRYTAYHDKIDGLHTRQNLGSGVIQKKLTIPRLFGNERPNK